MDISGSYTLYAPREQVWDALLDPDTLKRAVPRCESLERTSDNEYTLRLHVDVAGVKGIYDSTLKALDAQKPDSYRLVADGAGARGILHGDGTLRLEAKDAGTTVVNYVGQAQLGGTIASIGVGVAGSAAKHLINEFFARLADALGASVPVATPAMTATAATTASIAQAPTPPADELAAPAAASLDSPLPRTAPIIAPHMSSAAPAAPAETLTTPATPAPAPEATTPAAVTPTAAPARQQQPGWLHWLRRLLRIE